MLQWIQGETAPHLGRGITQLVGSQAVGQFVESHGEDQHRYQGGEQEPVYVHSLLPTICRAASNSPSLPRTIPSTRSSLSLSSTRPTAGPFFIPRASRSSPLTLSVRWRISTRYRRTRAAPGPRLHARQSEHECLHGRGPQGPVDIPVAHLVLGQAFGEQGPHHHRGAHHGAVRPLELQPVEPQVQARRGSCCE